MTTLKKRAKPARNSSAKRRGRSQRQNILWGNSPAVPTLIERMVRRIVRRFHPHKIILFGSQARGLTNRDSDVDLLVVMPVESSTLDKSVEIGCALHTIGVAKDIIVVTPEKFEKRKDIIGTLAYEAEQEGKILYARPE